MQGKLGAQICGRVALPQDPEAGARAPLRRRARAEAGDRPRHARVVRGRRDARRRSTTSKNTTGAWRLARFLASRDAALCCRKANQSVQPAGRRRGRRRVLRSRARTSGCCSSSSRLGGPDAEPSRRGSTWSPRSRTRSSRRSTARRRAAERDHRREQAHRRAREDHGTRRAVTTRAAKRRRRFEPATWILLSPWILALVVFVALPVRLLVRRSRSIDYSPLASRPRRASSASRTTPRRCTIPLFWTALGNTLVFVFGTIPFTTALALGLALALKRAFRGRDFYPRGLLPADGGLGRRDLASCGRALYAPDGPLSALAARARPHAAALAARSAHRAARRSWRWMCGRRAATTWSSSSPGSRRSPTSCTRPPRSRARRRWRRFAHITLPHAQARRSSSCSSSTAIRSLQIFTEVFVMTRRRAAALAR